MQACTPKNMTIGNRTLVHLGEITQHPNSNKLMLHIADLDVWGAHKDCPACYLFSADGVARYRGHSHCLGLRMRAYFEEISSPIFGRSTSGDQAINHIKSSPPTTLVRSRGKTSISTINSAYHG
jgi:hypothetical protein